jgi:hypothetical protein
MRRHKRFESSHMHMQLFLNSLVFPDSFFQEKSITVRSYDRIHKNVDASTVSLYLGTLDCVTEHGFENNGAIILIQFGK